MAELHRAWAAGHVRSKYAGHETIRKEAVRRFLEKRGFQRKTTIIGFNRDQVLPTNIHKHKYKVPNLMCQAAATKERNAAGFYLNYGTFLNTPIVTIQLSKYKPSHRFSSHNGFGLRQSIVRYVNFSVKLLLIKLIFPKSSGKSLLR